MKIRFFVKGNSPETRDALFTAERLRDRGFEVEKFDTESQDGIETATLYDIFDTPTFLATMDDGTLLNSWFGRTPSESEILGYLGDK